MDRFGTPFCQGVVAVVMSANRSGYPGRYFNVLKCDLMNGLSFDTRGLECDFVTLRPVRRPAAELTIIGEPRSAWIVTLPLSMLGQ